MSYKKQKKSIWKNNQKTQMKVMKLGILCRKEHVAAKLETTARAGVSLVLTALLGNVGLNAFIRWLIELLAWKTERNL